MPLIFYVLYISHILFSHDLELSKQWVLQRDGSYLIFVNHCMRCIHIDIKTKKKNISFSCPSSIYLHLDGVIRICRAFYCAWNGSLYPQIKEDAQKEEAGWFKHVWKWVFSSESTFIESVIISCICMTFSSRGQDILPYLEGNAQ